MNIYEKFLDTTLEKLKDLQLQTEMEDQHLAEVIGSTISSAMTSSIAAVRVLKQNSLVDEEIRIREETRYTIKAKRRMEQGVKEASEDGIVYEEDMCKFKDGAQISLLCRQREKTTKEIEYVEAQKESLLKQVEHNALIHAGDKQAKYTTAIATGGLVPSATQHSNFFKTINKLTSSAGLDLAEDVGSIPKR